MHSFCALPMAENLDRVLSLTDYGEQRYISMVQKEIFVRQFHPEKSGIVGLNILGSFLERAGLVSDGADAGISTLGNPLEVALAPFPKTQLVKRVIGPGCT